MKPIECPKCQKGLVRVKNCANKSFRECKCLWCGHEFKKLKDYAKTVNGVYRRRKK